MALGSIEKKFLGGIGDMGRHTADAEGCICNPSVSVKTYRRQGNWLHKKRVIHNDLREQVQVNSQTGEVITV